MEFKTGAKGSRRKELVNAMSEILNCPVIYDGAPSFSYTVGYFSVSREGAVTGPPDRELLEALAEQGFTGEISGAEEIEVPADTDIPDIDQHHPGQYTDPDAPMTEAMLKQAEAWMKAQPDGNNREAAPEINPDADDEAAESLDAEPDTDIEITDAQEIVPDVADGADGKLAIEMSLEGFTPVALDNLTTLIDSKAGLIKKAIGADALPVVQTADGKLRFEWFPYTEDSYEVGAYAMLIAQLCAVAKEQKRVTAKEKPVENEKFAFRVFLIRLGFIGDEYKAARKILLRNLSGNSSWKNGAPPKITESAAAGEEL